MTSMHSLGQSVLYPMYLYEVMDSRSRNELAASTANIRHSFIAVASINVKVRHFEKLEAINWGSNLCQPSIL
jgi:hypothetical protein